MPYVFAIITLDRHERAVALAAQAAEQDPPPAEITIVNNGAPHEFPRRLNGIPVNVLAPGFNLGVAASWNACARLHFPADLIISNDDSILRPGECARLLAQDADVVTCGGWWRFLARAEAWAELGGFDENIWPAYFEDNDFSRRLSDSGLRHADLPDLLDGHRPSGEPWEGWAFTPPWWERQRQYLDEKWETPASGEPDPAPPRSIAWDLTWFTRQAATPEEADHLRRLSALAEGLGHVTAMGTRGGPEATALLSGQPERLVLIDDGFPPEAERLYFFRGETTVQLLEADPMAVELEPTQLLLIAAEGDGLAALTQRHGAAAERVVSH
jgi:hypothetical protein